MSKYPYTAQGYKKAQTWLRHIGEYDKVINGLTTLDDHSLIREANLIYEKRQPFCKRCFHEVDGQHSVGTRERVFAAPGHICICFYCGNISMYDNDMKLNTMTDEDFTKLSYTHPSEYDKMITVQEAILKRLKFEAFTKGRKV